MEACSANATQVPVLMITFRHLQTQLVAISQEQSAIAAGVLPTALKSVLLHWISQMCGWKRPLTDTVSADSPDRPPAAASSRYSKLQRINFTQLIRDLLAHSHVLWRRRCALQKPP
jgi:hypothetical protein